MATITTIQGTDKIGDSRTVINTNFSNLNSELSTAVQEADYNANTILVATADNTPTALTVGEQTLVGRITAGEITALSAAQIRTLLNVEDGAQANIAESDPVVGAITGIVKANGAGAISAAVAGTDYQGVLSEGAFANGDKTKLDALVSGAVLDSDYNSNTILAATANNTPAAVTVAEQTLVGRITSGNITALTAAQIRTLLNIENGADATDADNVNSAGAVMESDYNANTILAATSDNTPAALTVAEQTLVGRITSGSIDALTATEVRALLNVEDGSEENTIDSDPSSDGVTGSDQITNITSCTTAEYAAGTPDSSTIYIITDAS